MFVEMINIRTGIRYVSSFVAAWYFYKHFIKPFLSPLRKIPGCPYRPFIGNLLETLKAGATNNGIRWMQKYDSRIIRFYFLGGEGAVLVGDPDLAKHILISNSKNYVRNPDRFLDLIAPGFIALISGEKHHALRRLINPVFNSHSVEGFIPVFEELGERLVKKWQGIIGGDASAVVNAHGYMSRLTLDAICRCGFDYEMKAIENDQSPEVKAFKSILGGLQMSVLRMLNLNWLPTRNNRKIQADIYLYKSTISQVISSKLEKLHQGDTSRDILSMLLQATDENGQHLSKELLNAHVGGFLIAGYDTTGTTLTWTLLELATHHDIQERARQEVMSTMPDRSETLTLKHIDSLSYLDCVVKESLRIHTPLSTLFRRSLKDDCLQGYLIPAGTLVGINMGALHRLPENWPEPESFKPERFLRDYNKAAFLPFGAGAYMCIGNLFSLTETKLTLALILRHFHIALPAGYKYKSVRKLAVQPSPPLQLIVTPL